MNDLEKRISGYMSVPRFEHTLSVVNECRSLASLFGIDEGPLTAAGYLHDITKELPVEKQLELCEEYGIEIDCHTIMSPKTLHAFSAPALIKRDFPEYFDEKIISAVRYHTTGKADMNLYEKLLFLADYIEPTRNYESCKELRRFFYSRDVKDIEVRLDTAVLTALGNTLKSLRERGEYVHPLTVSAYDFLSKNTPPSNN